MPLRRHATRFSLPTPLHADAFLRRYFMMITLPLRQLVFRRHVMLPPRATPPPPRGYLTHGSLYAAKRQPYALALMLILRFFRFRCCRYDAAPAHIADARFFFRCCQRLPPLCCRCCAMLLHTTPRHATPPDPPLLAAFTSPLIFYFAPPCYDITALPHLCQSP